MSSNLSVNRTAQKLRFWVPSALRAPAAPHFYVEAVEKPLFGGILDKEMARFHRAISVSGFAD